MNYLFLYFFIFFISCVQAQKQSYNINIDNLVGEYTGQYNNTQFDLWVEAIKQKDNSSSYKLSVFIFKKNNIKIVTNFLNTYPNDLDLTKSNICEHVKKQDTVNLPFKYLRAVEIWTWPNIGGLSFGEINSNTKYSKINLQVAQYILFDNNDEHAITSININSKGEVIKINFLETGFIKKPWNYVLGGPSLQVQKISNKTQNIITQYNNREQEVDNLLTQAKCVNSYK